MLAALCLSRQAARRAVLVALSRSPVVVVPMAVALLLLAAPGPPALAAMFRWSRAPVLVKVALYPLPVLPSASLAVMVRTVVL